MSSFIFQRVPIHGIIVSGFFVLITWGFDTFTNTTIKWNWTCWYKIAWLFPLFYAITSFIGLNIPEPKTQTIKYDVAKTIKMCFVSKGTNIDALERTLQSIKWIHMSGGNEKWQLFDEDEFEYNHTSTNTRLFLYLVIDDGPYVSQIEEILKKSPIKVKLVVVPKSFITQYAKYKSRALEYFRIVYVRDTDWVLHMDEESTIDAENFSKCIDFVHTNKYDIGQGLILYNYTNYNQWTFVSKLITVCDGLRVTDDLGRYRLQYHWIHKPIFGLHGSFLMIRGSIENKITWNYRHAGNLTEDYAFAMECISQSPCIKCGAISGIVREVSPQTIRDFMRQRRRWLIGVLTLPYFWPRFMCACWIMGSFTVLATLLHIIFTIIYQNTLPLTPVWLGVLSTFSFVVSIYMYLMGLLIEHIDKMRQEKCGWIFTVSYIIGHFFLTIPLLVCSSILETTCIYYSLFTRKPKSFDVVKK